ncbi:hypothetical protein Dimus_030313, partial [Dionaea muscipula]
MQHYLKHQQGSGINQIRAQLEPSTAAKCGPQKQPIRSAAAASHVRQPMKQCRSPIIIAAQQ